MLSLSVQALIINQISDSQLKSCDTAMREIKKEAAALDDC
jgi:hypothetical protein